MSGGDGEARWEPPSPVGDVARPETPATKTQPPDQDAATTSVGEDLVEGVDLYAGPDGDEDHYRLKRSAGGGGEGEVYEALVAIDSSEVRFALKIRRQRPDEVGTDSVDLVTSDWARQLELVQGLNHPSVLRMHRSFVGPEPHALGERGTGRAAYLVMDWADGVDGRQWVRDHPDRTLDDVLTIVRAIGDGLVYMHSGADTITRVLHRDIKPANVIIDRQRGQYTVTLVDFGLTRDASVIHSGGGTPGYLAPEAGSTAGNSVSIDIYALAGTAFFLVTGVDPPSPLAAVRSALARAGLVANEPRVVEAIIQGLQPDRRQRPPEVRNWLEMLPDGGTERAVSLMPPPPPVAPRRSTHKLLLVITAVVALLAAGWWALSDRLTSAEGRTATQPSTAGTTEVQDAPGTSETNDGDTEITEPTTTTATPSTAATTSSAPPTASPTVPVVAAPTTEIIDVNPQIPEGVIENGVHFGCITDVGDGWFEFDRVDQGEAGWINEFAFVRTLPVAERLEMQVGTPIRVTVEDQRVAGVAVSDPAICVPAIPTTTAPISEELVAQWGDEAPVIPAGVIGEGGHFGLLVAQGDGTMTFDRVTVNPNGTWTNANSELLRALPTAGPIGLPNGSTIHILISDQRLVRVWLVRGVRLT